VSSAERCVEGCGQWMMEQYRYLPAGLAICPLRSARHESTLACLPLRRQRYGFALGRAALAAAALTHAPAARWRPPTHARPATGAGWWGAAASAGQEQQQQPVERIQSPVTCSCCICEGCGPCCLVVTVPDLVQRLYIGFSTIVHPCPALSTSHQTPLPPYALVLASD
jgi:hypothetical protein